MAKFYTLKTTVGGLRYFVTKGEAAAALDLARAGSMAGSMARCQLDVDGEVDEVDVDEVDVRSMAGSMARCQLDVDGEVDEVDVDEVDVRSMAARWLNLKAVNQENALKREAKKTAKQRSDNMRKAWATRRKNTES